MKGLREILLFSLIGASQLALDTAIYIVLTWAGSPTPPANLCGRLSGAALGFWLNGKVTFASRQQPALVDRFMRYVALWLLMTAISTALLIEIKNGSNLLNTWWSKPLIEASLGIVSFLASRFWIYHKQESYGTSRAYEGRRMTRSTWLFLLFATLIQLPMVFIGGYFSHDELQWLARSDTDSLSAVQWISWLDYGVFQYRPLTFNFWLFVSHYFGYQPEMLHGIQSILAIANATLLRNALTRYGVPFKTASISSLAFLIVPFVVFTHSWIGTFADQFSLTFLLLIFLCALRYEGTNKLLSDTTCLVLSASILTILALSCKESSVVFPSLLAGLLFIVSFRTALITTISSSVFVIIYLSLRLNVILFAPRDPGVYSWSVSNIPFRLFEYSTFPFLRHLYEIVGYPWWDEQQLLIGSCGLVVLLAIMLSAGYRWLICLIVIWFISLAPVLILSKGYGQYAYIGSAFVCALFAMAYPKIKFWPKILLALLSFLLFIHSVAIVRYMRRVGQIQNNLYISLEKLLPTRSTENPIYIRALRSEDEPILRHLTFSIPTYHRIPFSPYIRAIVTQDINSVPEYFMLPNGILIAIDSSSLHAE